MRWSELVAWAVERHARRRAAKARREIAAQFNQSNVIADARLSMWMCPTCLRIHPAIDAKPLGVLDFPACCEHARGPRADRRRAAGGAP